ncbi:MAG: trigger factor [Chloroflexi bacterium]|nr:trigger factor [Chloroflexota bacterium]
MKLQTERISDHRAQFTIEIEAEQLEDAKQKAARKISRQVRIKGFRKGKAPYRLVAQHVGEGAILEEAVEALGDVLYKQALEESEVLPYGPGAFDDFKLEPAPTFVFSVPLQPEVDLKDYRDVRVEFEEPEIAADQVEQALRQIQLRATETIDEEVEVAAAGNRVTIAVESEFIDGESPKESTEDDEAPPEGDGLADNPGADEESEPSNTQYVPLKGDTFVKDENAIIILDPNEDPFTHGFVGHLIGAELGSDVEFELTIPDDDADETIIGRRVKFFVTLKKIEEISIPELDDDFARQVSRNRGDEELNLPGLRASTQEELERSALSDAKVQYSGKVLEEIVDGAETNYADVTLEEHIDEMIGDFERNLAQQRIKLEDYYRLTNSTKDDLREQHRDRAIQSLRQTLVLREIVRAQEIEVSEEDMELRLDTVTAGYGSSPEIRKLFDTPQMRDNIRNELVMNQLNEHLVAIGRGDDPIAAVEAMRARMKEDAERAQARSERLQRYQAEDGAPPSPSDESSSGAEGDPVAEAETLQPGDDVASHEN